MNVDEDEVACFLFDVNGNNKNKFFHKDNLLTSSYEDATSDQDYNQFSIKG